jgi:hypothetical protein
VKLNNLNGLSALIYNILGGISKAKSKTGIFFKKSKLMLHSKKYIICFSQPYRSVWQQKEQLVKGSC